MGVCLSGGWRGGTVVRQKEISTQGYLMFKNVCGPEKDWNIREVLSGLTWLEHKELSLSFPWQFCKMFSLV